MSLHLANHPGQSSQQFRLVNIQRLLDLSAVLNGLAGVQCWNVKHARPPCLLLVCLYLHSHIFDIELTTHLETNPSPKTWDIHLGLGHMRHGESLFSSQALARPRECLEAVMERSTGVGVHKRSFARFCVLTSLL